MKAMEGLSLSLKSAFFGITRKVLSDTFLAQISQSISKLPFADSIHSTERVAHSPQGGDHNNWVDDATLIVRDQW
jgi:hypothetical protein